MYLYNLPSSLSWCEQDYTHSKYIAEYYNTITGFCLIISSIICYKQFNHYKLKTSQFLLFLVGVGTILFHGTLLYIWQLLDEIPMILIVIEYLKIFFPDNKRIYYFYILIPIIIGSYFINTNLQVISFQASFILLVLVCLRHLRKVNKTKNKTSNKIGLFILFTSSLVWSIENNFCKYYPDYIQLHALWHILTSIGMYYLNKIIFNILIDNTTNNTTTI